MLTTEEDARYSELINKGSDKTEQEIVEMEALRVKALPETSNNPEGEGEPPIYT